MENATPAVDPEAQAALRGVKSWMRLTSVLGFIWSAGLFIGVACMLFVAFQIGAKTSAGLVLLAGAASYVVMGLIGWFLATLLHRSANSLSTLLAEPSRENWVEFLRRERKLWVSIGLFALLNFLLSLAFVAILLAQQFRTT